MQPRHVCVRVSVDEEREEGEVGCCCMMVSVPPPRPPLTEALTKSRREEEGVGRGFGWECGVFYDKWHRM